MSQSVQSAALDAVVSALAGAGLRAERCRMEPYNADELPAANVLPESEDGEYLDTDSIELRHKFTVRLTAVATNQVDKAVDAQLYVPTMKAILTDPTLGGIVRFTRYLSRKWEMEPGEGDYTTLVVTFEVEFSTSRIDPSRSWG